MGDRTLVKFKFIQNFNLLKVSESCDIIIQLKKKVKDKTSLFSSIRKKQYANYCGCLV